MSPPHDVEQRVERAPGLLERLMEVVLPEFRGEVFYPPRDSLVFVQGTCRIASCGIALSFASRRLCQGHYQRWRKAGRPDLDGWTAAEDVATRRRTVAAAHRGGVRGPGL